MQIQKFMERLNTCFFYNTSFSTSYKKLLTSSVGEPEPKSRPFQREPEPVKKIGSRSQSSSPIQRETEPVKTHQMALYLFFFVSLFSKISYSRRKKLCNSLSLSLSFYLSPFFFLYFYIYISPSLYLLLSRSHSLSISPSFLR